MAAGVSGFTGDAASLPAAPDLPAGRGDGRAAHERREPSA